MGLISLVLLCAFTLLYLSSAIKNKPTFVEQALGFIKQNLNYIAMGGLIYGFVALCISPISAAGGMDVFVRMLANLLIILMAIPYTFEKLIAEHEARINAALLREARNIIAAISAKSNIFGYTGAVVALLLFLVVFK